MTPTEPGLYLWRPNGSAAWVAVEVVQCRDGNWVDPSLVVMGVEGGRVWASSVERLEKSSAQWGPRIPEPPHDAGTCAGWTLVWRPPSDCQWLFDATEEYMADADNRRREAERWRAMEELAAAPAPTTPAGPLPHNARWRCFYCGTETANVELPRHAPTCPWLRAQPEEKPRA